EDEGVDAGGAHRLEVLPGGGQHLRPGGGAGLDELDEPRGGGHRQLQVRGGGEGVLVGTRADRRGGPDDADPSGAGRGHRASHGRLDDLHDRHAGADRVPLAGVAQHGGGGGVAGDDQGLDAGGDQSVHDVQRHGADLG